MSPVWDALYGVWVVPITCPCCTKCWLIVEGKGRGRCVHGGPYKGYVTVLEVNAEDTA